MLNQEFIQNLEKKCLAMLDLAVLESDLAQCEIDILGRKGMMSTALRALADASVEDRKTFGPKLQELKKSLEANIAARKAALEHAKESEAAALFDPTFPVEPTLPIGHMHPVTQIVHEIEDIFSKLGFAVADGPELETERYNFDALNFPKNHPARDMQDTFWVKTDTREHYLLRTHTSPVQVRYMEKHTPPLRVIIPGKVYRNEATDASHEHTFHQFECLVVDTDVSVANFLWLAETFFTEFFHKKTKVRLRPSFFPFTEPSFEFDIACHLCDQKGCSVYKGTGWLEIGGAGMVHQNVLVAAGYERGKYTGFAWGFGVTRLALMRYHISDIRLLLSGDTHFLSQF